MRKIKFIGLTMVLMGATLVSCNPSNGGITKIYLGMWPDAALTREVAMFQEWKAAFENDHPEYEIIPSTYEYDPITAVTKAQAGELPTIFQTWFTEPEMLKSGGYIRDITAQITELDWLRHMDEDMKSILTFDDKIYGVPRDGYGLGMVLNLQMLDYHGLLVNPETGLREVDASGKLKIKGDDGTPFYPTTFEEVYRWAEIINEQSGHEEKGLLVLSANEEGGWQFSNMAWNFGANLQVQGSDGKWHANLTDPKAVEALEWIRRLSEDHLVLGNDAGNESSVVYSDWYSKLAGERVGMAFIGNDVVQLAVTSGKMNLDDIALVPMPAGPYGDRHALFGGTPFVFAHNASDAEVTGALMFLEYMGRSPLVSEVSLKALEDGAKVSQAKNIPIIPSWLPWINSEYTAAVAAINAKYSNIHQPYYEDYFALMPEMRRKEDKYSTQYMYTLLDNCISQILAKPNSNALALLTDANGKLETRLNGK
ncbi:MAG: extracellular solute-binding protein [Erysipelotrichaceae bacterium]|jgi:ABC-type glycerol-3-phosphate transport system substrate-binding protein|nr:extracellular solute-binding protein [Erysipelotrichaceae bacterium]